MDHTFAIPISLVRPGMPQQSAGYLCGFEDNTALVQFWEERRCRNLIGKRCPQCKRYYILKECPQGCPMCSEAVKETA
jgi:hypothetical protein